MKNINEARLIQKDGRFLVEVILPKTSGGSHSIESSQFNSEEEARQYAKEKGFQLSNSFQNGQVKALQEIQNKMDAVGVKMENHWEGWTNHRYDTYEIHTSVETNSRKWKCELWGDRYSSEIRWQDKSPLFNSEEEAVSWAKQKIDAAKQKMKQNKKTSITIKAQS